MIIKKSLFWWALALMASISLTSTSIVSIAAVGDFADLIFTDAKIYTVDTSKPWAQTVAIKDGRFVYVGDNEGVEKWIGSKTEKVDLGGKFVLPGLVDSHTHPGMSAVYSEMTTMPFTDSTGMPYTSREDTLAWLKKFSKENPDLPAIVAGSWRVADFGPEGPNKRELDEIVSDRPVILMEQWGHSQWMNSKALEMLGVTRNSEDPAPGLAFFQRDSTGEPTGLSMEYAHLPLWRKLLRPTKKLSSKMLTILDYLSSQGVTSILDAGNLAYDEEVYAALSQLDKKGRLPLRIEGSYHIYLPNRIDNAVAELKRLRSAYSGDKLTLNTIKIHFDGIAPIYTSALLSPYSDNAKISGTTLFDESRLLVFMRELHKEKIDLHIHVTGDNAARIALNAYEAITDEIGKQPDTRLTLCHLDFMSDEDVPRFRQLGVVANFTPHWHGLSETELGFQTLGERKNRTMRAKPLLDDGAVVSFSSDQYSLEALAQANPFLGMQTGHNRQGVIGGIAAPVVPPIEDRVSLKNMIKGYTYSGAYQLNMEDQLGSIEVGKKADMVVLSDNLFEVNRYELYKVKVETTLLDGEVVFNLQ